MTLPELDSLELALAFHPYQRDALEALLHKWRAGERQLHLVAPPGAGKTLLGLELFRRLGQRAVVLSPTGTIAGQWIHAARAHFVDLSGIDALPELRSVPLAGSDPAQTPLLLSLTYQRVSVKGEAGLHTRVEVLFEQLAAQGYRTLILDECHHLLAHWARAIEQFLLQVPEAVVIGLTATPPLDRSGKELASYLKLVGAVDYEILAPAVIREGHLAPFQDLVYMVRPSESEAQFLAQAHRELLELLQAGENPPPGRPALSFWAEDWLLHPLSPAGETLEARRLLETHPDLTIACVRYLASRGLYPRDLPWCPEMEDAPELADYAELLGAYALALQDAPDTLQDVGRVLGQLGYVWQRNRFVSRPGEIDRVLAFSAAKLRAAAEILRHEAAILDTQLRALVLTDFERTHAPGKRARALVDPEAGGTLAIMRQFCADPDLRSLRPVMVTGQTLLCPRDGADSFMAAATAYCQRQGLKVAFSLRELAGDSHCLQLCGHGPAWTSGVWLACVTEWLTQGLSRCLIGTRGLLGEGWNCRCLNTLIDLTAVSSFVSVNQIRGRTLRQDPDQPGKVANNWDVVALLPELSTGFRDFERFVRKHAHFYGLSDDGRLEQGVGHVHPLFEQLERSALMGHLEAINAEMRERAAARAEAHRAWQVGTPYRNRELSGLQWRLPEQLPEAAARQQTALAPLNTLPRLQQQHQRELAVALAHHQQQWLAFQGLSWGLTLALAAGLLPALGPLWPLWFGGSQALGVLWQRRREHVLQAKHVPEGHLVTALGEVVLRSLQDEGLVHTTERQISLSQRSGGFQRLSLEGAEPAESQQFVQALSEMLAPLQEQRYLLAIPQLRGAVISRWLLPARQRFVDAGTVYLPLPRYFARSRERAELFLGHFGREIGPAELIYTRQGAGRERLQTLQRQRAVWTRAQTVRVWE
ncbi:MAG: DEAD/DEAH box helicase family protein [Candidatus Sericytochromatia bacterium]